MKHIRVFRTKKKREHSENSAKKNRFINLEKDF